MTPESLPTGEKTAAHMQLALRHYENFPVGSWLVPRRCRTHLHRIYAFARTADDLADELRDPVALQAFRDDFTAHLAGATSTPLLADLTASIRDLSLPEQLFYDLLDAFAQDLTVLRYDDDEGLFDYCRRSADPVGRLVLRVFGHDDDALDRPSDRICTGLQLLNHLQDIREDLIERDRIYFPRRDLERFGVREDELRETTGNARVLELVRYWWGRTRDLLREGWPLTGMVRGRLRLELRAIVGGAGGVLRAIDAADYDVLSGKIRLSKLDHLRVLLRAIGTSKPPRVLG